nr:RNA-directed DNA polymerase, eukaryota, reverse transcriptase zinc-binding domain protein [Tanacetum cinerariifolium]
MGGPRSKEDEVHKISISLFISNFSDQFTAKDLFNTCKQYGHVVDAFIPNKRSKAGKRFGFVRFIKVFDAKRLVDNLSTICVRRFKFLANIARFQRSPLNNESGEGQNKVGESSNNSNNTNVKAEGVQVMANSYVHVVKGGLQSVNGEADFTPTLVLNDEYYMGDASWFTRLIQASMDFNIDERVAWVEIEGVLFKMWYVNTFRRIASKWGTLIHVDGQEEDCFHRKRLCLITKVGRNIVESFKIVFHGKVFWIRAKEVPGWVPDFMDDSDEEYDTDGDTTTGGSLGEDVFNCGDVSDVEEVSDTKFEEGLDALNVEEVSTGQENKHSDDPFNLYDLLNKKNKSDDKGNKSDNSLKYPLGFTPVHESEVNEKKDDESKKDSGDCSQRNLEEEENLGTKDKCLNKNSIDDAAESVCSGRFKKSEAPRTGGSILNLMNELVKVGEVIIMGDFNEVRKNTKRFGSMFNVQGANLFNMFIANAGLEEVPLVEDSWKETPMVESNAITNLMLKLKHLKTLSSDQQEDLEIEVSREEIKRSVWDCGTDKSPGPDGFTFGFYRRYWKIVKKEVVDVVTYFFTHGFLPKGSNSSFIALISKISDANMVKDFRHISLIGSLYKIIAKILANRLVVVLGDTVNEVQSAFVTDRHILDGPFILNELFQWCKVKKKQSLIFKVDFEMAYDSVRWEFLDDVLRKFGFGEKWCNWIQSCLRSSRVMESLHISFQRVVEAEMFKGVTLISSLQISHMFYEDDAVIVGQWNDVNIDTIIHVLECFFYASGMRISKSKRSKVGGLMSRIKSWNEVVDRVTSRLSKWKMTMLSIGGSFFNGHDINSKKTSWVKWKNVLASKEKGGLGVSSLGLMFKWVWRFYAQNNSLWAKVIKAIHGDDGKVGKKTKSVFQSIWIDIVHEMESLKNQDIDILKCMKFKLGNGAHTAFWNEVWCGDIAFKNLYPRLYALESCKDIVVSSKLAHPCLDHSFRRAPRSGVEQEQFIALINQVQSVSLVPCRDRRVWSLEGSEEFSVASVRKLIDDKMLPEVSFKTRWVKAITIKVNVHAWKVRLDYLPTRFNISRRGMDIKSISCPICDNGVESTSHLFFSCQIVKDIVRKIVRRWDISYMELSSYEERVIWLSNLLLSSRKAWAREMAQIAAPEGRTAYLAGLSRFYFRKLTCPPTMMVVLSVSIAKLCFFPYMLLSMDSAECAQPQDPELHLGSPETPLERGKA